MATQPRLHHLFPSSWQVSSSPFFFSSFWVASLMIVIVVLICRGWGTKLLALVVLFRKGEVGMQMITCRFSWGGFVMDVVHSQCHGLVLCSIWHCDIMMLPSTCQWIP
jgi:hypothetical protein